MDTLPSNITRPAPSGAAPTPERPPARRRLRFLRLRVAIVDLMDAAQVVFQWIAFAGAIVLLPVVGFMFLVLLFGYSGSILSMCGQ